MNLMAISRRKAQNRTPVQMLFDSKRNLLLRFSPAAMILAVFVVPAEALAWTATNPAQHGDNQEQATELQRIDIRKNGAFGFPQPAARVLTDTEPLRLSVFTDERHLYVQAVLWKDDSDELGTTRDGRPIGDYSNLLLDVDAAGSITANIDRSYSLNAWPRLPGLRYSIQLGDGAATGLQSDSAGRGAIRYVPDISSRLVRIDSFLIPLEEIGKEPGERIRFAFYASSTVPEFIVNSVGYESEQHYWAHQLPHDKYHEVTLAAGSTMLVPETVPDGQQDDVPDAANPAPLAQLPTVGEAPPDLTAGNWINTDGQLTLDNLRGKVIVVEFWATWCGPCIAGIPKLNELHEAHYDDGLRIVAFTDQAHDHVKDFISRTPMHFALGTDSQLIRAYGVTGIPHTFIISRDGLLRWHGHPGSDAFAQQLKAALAE